MDALLRLVMAMSLTNHCSEKDTNASLMLDGEEERNKDPMVALVTT